MSNNNWQQIWGQRKTLKNSELKLRDLIDLNGFDKGAGKVEASDWLNYAKIIIEKLNIKEKNSILEVGCGSGALLYAIREHIDVTLGGIDFSDNLISVAKYMLPEAKFQVSEANNIVISDKYDFIISNAVFHYFDLDYAGEVMLNMVKILNQGGAIFIMDVPNLTTKTNLELIRRQELSNSEYDVMYKNLAHTYYDQKYFTKFAQDFGLSCEIMPSFIPNYKQADYRFSVLLKNHV
jgi:cyclopropane fatty-acyl-phospholipid synthase-like methyltransferase